jgi:replicative DNA helicase
MKLSAPIYILKQQAKALARKEKFPLHQALDRIANREGFNAWSQLAARLNSDEPSAALLSQLNRGDLVLLGARPGQGKTLLAIGLAIESMARGNRSAFFTLEFTEADVARCFAVLNKDINSFRDRFLLDDSDRISASYIVARLTSAPPNMLVVIDYLQLLDQKRDNPSAMEQVAELKRFAREHQLIIVCLSQIDRRFDPESKSCPRLADVRLPNPLDLSLFDKACFLNGGRMQVAAAGWSAGG